MAQVKIEEIVDHLSSNVRRACVDAVQEVLPGTNLDAAALFHVFKRAVRPQVQYLGECSGSSPATFAFAPEPSIGHFYFAQIGHSHFAATQRSGRLSTDQALKYIPLCSCPESSRLGFATTQVWDGTRCCPTLTVAPSPSGPNPFAPRPTSSVPECSAGPTAPSRARGARRAWLSGPRPPH